MIETDQLQLRQSESIMVDTLQESAKGQQIVHSASRGAVEPLPQWQHDGGTRARGHAAGTVAVAAGHPHLHLDQTAVGDASAGRACRGRILRPHMYWPEARLAHLQVLLLAIRAETGQRIVQPEHYAKA